MKKFNTLLIDSIKKLQKGDVFVPISRMGTASQSEILHQLDKLRLVILAEKDREAELNEQNKTAVASVAHDMKTPLAIIAGYAESIQDENDDKDYLSLIQEKVNQMNEMVVSLVEASQQELQYVPVPRQKVYAREFFEEELQKLAPLAKAESISFSVGKIPNRAIRIDKQQIARVLQNLISNAIHYTKNGKIKVKFSILGQQLVVKVCDNGSGISNSAVRHVFDKFFMEDKSRTASNSGLGLYLCKETLNKHGGSISVKSKKNKGSTFTFKLPIEENPFEEKQDFTQKFESLSKFTRIFILTIFCWIMPMIFRFARASQTKCITTLVGGFLCLPFFIFVSWCDIICIVVYNKITFLAD